MNYWLVEIYEDDTVNVSVTSEEEIEATKGKDQLEDWMYEEVGEATKEEMVERAEERGYEHDPW